MDTDNDEDRIKDFLLSKLRMAKSCTSTLQDSVEIRQNVLNKLQKQLNYKDTKINASEISTKTLRGHYIVKVDILNDTHRDCYNSRCILHWNSSEELIYTSVCYAEDDTQTNKKNPSNFLASLIVVIRKPKFLKQTSYTVNGVFTYNISSDSEEEFQSVLPGINLNINDFSN